MSSHDINKAINRLAEIGRRPDKPISTQYDLTNDLTPAQAKQLAAKVGIWKAGEILANLSKMRSGEFVEASELAEVKSALAMVKTTSQPTPASKSVVSEVVYKSKSLQQKTLEQKVLREDKAKRIAHKAQPPQDPFWASVGLYTEKAMSLSNINKLLDLIDSAALGTVLNEATVINLLRTVGYEEALYIVNTLSTAKGK